MQNIDCKWEDLIAKYGEVMQVVDMQLSIKVKLGVLNYLPASISASLQARMSRGIKEELRNYLN